MASSRFDVLATAFVFVCVYTIFFFFYAKWYFPQPPCAPPLALSHHHHHTEPQPVLQSPLWPHELPRPREPREPTFEPRPQPILRQRNIGLIPRAERRARPAPSLDRSRPRERLFDGTTWSQRVTLANREMEEEMAWAYEADDISAATTAEDEKRAHEKPSIETQDLHATSEEYLDSPYVYSGTAESTGETLFTENGTSEQEELANNTTKTADKVDSTTATKDGINESEKLEKTAGKTDSTTATEDGTSETRDLHANSEDALDSPYVYSGTAESTGDSLFTENGTSEQQELANNTTKTADEIDSTTATEIGTSKPQKLSINSDVAKYPGKKSVRFLDTPNENSNALTGTALEVESAAAEGSPMEITEDSSPDPLSASEMPDYDYTSADGSAMAMDQDSSANPLSTDGMQDSCDMPADTTSTTSVQDGSAIPLPAYEMQNSYDMPADTTSTAIVQDSSLAPLPTYEVQDPYDAPADTTSTATETQPANELLKLDNKAACEKLWSWLDDLDARKAKGRDFWWDSDLLTVYQFWREWITDQDEEKVIWNMYKLGRDEIEHFKPRLDAEFDCIKIRHGKSHSGDLPPVHSVAESLRERMEKAIDHLNGVFPQPLVAQEQQSATGEQSMSDEQIANDDQSKRERQIDLDAKIARQVQSEEMEGLEQQTRVKQQSVQDHGAPPSYQYHHADIPAGQTNAGPSAIPNTRAEPRSNAANEVALDFEPAADDDFDADLHTACAKELGPSGPAPGNPVQKPRRVTKVNRGLRHLDARKAQPVNAVQKESALPPASTKGEEQKPEGAALWRSKAFQEAWKVTDLSPDNDNRPLQSDEYTKQAKLVLVTAWLQLNDQIIKRYQGLFKPSAWKEKAASQFHGPQIEAQIKLISARYQQIGEYACVTRSASGDLGWTVEKISLENLQEQNFQGVVSTHEEFLLMLKGALEKDSSLSDGLDGIRNIVDEAYGIVAAVSRSIKRIVSPSGLFGTTAVPHGGSQGSSDLSEPSPSLKAKMAKEDGDKKASAALQVPTSKSTLPFSTGLPHASNSAGYQFTSGSSVSQNYGFQGSTAPVQSQPQIASTFPPGRG